MKKKNETELRKERAPEDRKADLDGSLKTTACRIGGDNLRRIEGVWLGKAKLEEKTAPPKKPTRRTRGVGRNWEHVGLQY